MSTARTARTARFYYDGELTGNSELSLSKQASHHLVTVLRTRQGDVIELFNGDGCNYRAAVVDAGQSRGKSALLQVQDGTPAYTESPVTITLVQAISRGDRMDTTLRQSVELGVSVIQPVHTRHSAKPLDEKRAARKQAHWQSIIISACEQSARARIPDLASPLTFDQWLSQLSAAAPDAPMCYLLSPTADATLFTCLQNQPARHFGLIIGPESGLDADEIERAIEVGVQAVTLGPRILRTETAGPACIALAQAALGDMR